MAEASEHDGPSAGVPTLGAAAVLALAVCAAAALRFAALPAAERLAAGQQTVTLSAVSAEVREQPDALPRSRQLLARRSDQVLLTTGPVTIVQSSEDWVTAGGRETLVESGGLYGVDGRSRANLAAYGDAARVGHYDFPVPAPRGSLTLQDPVTRVAAEARFEQVDRLQGLVTWRYALSVPLHDDSAAFVGLVVGADLRIEREAVGEIWVEPRTGIVVERSLRGSAWWVATDDGARLSEAVRWRAQFTPETRQQQSELAGRQRRWLLALEWWLPGACLGLGLMGAALLRRRRT